MTEYIGTNTYFCIVITLSAFATGQMLHNRCKSPLANPIMIAAVLVIFVLHILDIPTQKYQENCWPLQYFLAPATICYAIILYEQIARLKKNLVSIACGVVCGTLVSLVGIYAMCKVFAMDRVLTVSLLPKSITTAIGIALSEEADGIPSLTTAAIILSGILGNMFGPMLCKLFRIVSPIAQGVAFGTASHAIGTGRATEMSNLAGAVSSLSLTLAGLMTVVLYSFLI